MFNSVRLLITQFSGGGGGWWVVVINSCGSEITLFHAVCGSDLGLRWSLVAQVTVDPDGVLHGVGGEGVVGGAVAHIPLEALEDGPVCPGRLIDRYLYSN